MNNVKAREETQLESSETNCYCFKCARAPNVDLLKVSRWTYQLTNQGQYLNFINKSKGLLQNLEL